MKRIINSNLLFVLFIIFISFFAACDKETEDDTNVVARVYDNKLTIQDLSGIVPSGINKEDSIAVIKSNIESWVRKQAMLKQAEINLSDDLKDVEKIVADYRASLLIDRYKQEFLKKNLDTVVSDEEVNQYYKKSAENFKTDRELVKGIFIKVPLKFEELNRLKLLYYVDNLEKRKDILDFVNENNIPIKLFNENWMPFSELSSLLPFKKLNPDVFLRSNKKLQTQDSTGYYFVIIDEYKAIGEQKPLELVKDQIKMIIINKRKTLLISELEERIYENALDQGKLEILINK